MKTLEERFWGKVEKSTDPDGCWEWTAGRFSKGYGAFSIKGRNQKANRVAWQLVHGTIPEGLCVLHKCDNPGCVRPDHLFLGTNLDNSKDCSQKGRRPRGDRAWPRLHPERLARGKQNGAHTHPEKRPRGERQGLAKLVASQVVEIRSLYGMGSMSQRELAESYGVHQYTIWAIVNRKTWKHI